MEDGSCADTKETISKGAVDSFFKLFTNSASEYQDVFVPKMKLTDKGKAWLLRPISDDEIQRAVFEADPAKAPGPEMATLENSSRLLGRLLGRDS